MPDWKGAGPDKIQAFWLKFFAAVNEVLGTFYKNYGYKNSRYKNYASDERLKEAYRSEQLQTNCLPQLDMVASDRNH